MEVRYQSDANSAQSTPRANFVRRVVRSCFVIGTLVTTLAIEQVPALALPSPTYTGLVSARLLDTRPGSATVDGLFAGGGQVGAASAVNLTVLGRGGVPPTGVGAVAVNITVTQPTASSFITVYPAGAARPTASNLNFGPGQTIANMVIVPIGAGGQISFFNEVGQTHLLVDVLGWFGAGADYSGFSPTRLLDTRVGGPTIDGQFSGGGQVGAASVLNLAVLGRGGVPPSGVGAVVINVTVTAPTTNSYLTVYPSGAARPTASNLNFTGGQTIANLAIVPVGTNGKISLYNNAGQTQMLVDVLGWFTDAADFVAFSPARLLDTRAGAATVDGLFLGSGQVGPAAVLNLPVLGRGGVPASGVGSVAVNVTSTQPCASSSYVTVYPAGAARPNASNLNFSAGQTIANMVIVPVGSDGKISLYNNAGQTHLLVDVLGWFAGTPIAGPTPVSVTTSGGCPPTLSAISTDCTAMTNAHRANAGVAPLTISITLNAAAQGHSNYQASILTMTHDGPGGNSAGTRMTNAGFIWRAWGENVAYGYGDCAAVIAAWMNSPGHRTNMLNPAYTHIGVAVAIGSNGLKYWTMDLAAAR